MEIRQAQFPHDRDLVIQLFREYQQSLQLDLSFQNFEQEVEGLPGKYVPPRGALLLAGELGCIAMRPLSTGICEMKRLYLCPEARGQGAGKALVSAVVNRARIAGYSAMRLDTMPSMQSAIALYRQFGFQAIPPYCNNPVPGALFLELSL